MTAKHAERITGFCVRQLPSSGRIKTYGMYDGGVHLISGQGFDPSEALDRLVTINYCRVKQQVFTEQRWRCFHCWRLNVGLEADHIKPRSKGRDDSRTNLRGLCSKCHARVTEGEKLNAHPRMVELMSSVGLRWIGPWEGPMTPCGWERIK